MTLTSYIQSIIIATNMDSGYKFSMSIEDQRKFIEIDRLAKYGELLRNLKQKVEEQQDKQVNFKEQSSSKFVLARIDSKQMQATIEAFPLDLPLNDKNLYTYSEAQASFQKPTEKIYDVRFVMPLLYHSVSPSLFVDCRDFIARRCLALTITGISSEDHQMRALCYKILERYYEHLLSNLMIDKQLWINFLDLIRNSIPTPNAKLRFIFTTFLTKIIDILLHPHADKMYELIKEFLAGRPRLRIDTIEIYNDLLLCSDVGIYNNNLRWIITLFRDGTRSKNDLKVLLDLDVIPQVMCLYNSELRFQRANEIIFTLFKRITTIETGSSLLVNEFSFLPWLHQVILLHLGQELGEIKNDPKSESLIDISKEITSLVCNLVDSLLRDKKDGALAMPRLLELFNVFIMLHDLIIKSKNASNLEFYLTYARKVTKAIRKDKQILDQLACQILELIRAKLHYLT